MGSEQAPATCDEVRACANASPSFGPVLRQWTPSWTPAVGFPTEEAIRQSVIST